MHTDIIDIHNLLSINTSHFIWSVLVNVLRNKFPTHFIQSICNINNEYKCQMSMKLLK